MARPSGYIVMKIQTKMESGGELLRISSDQACLGVLPVFKTKKAARAIFGKDVKMTPMWKESE